MIFKKFKYPRKVMRKKNINSKRYWKKTIEENFWFDYIYIFKLIRHQINLMILNWDTSYSVNSQETKKEMQDVLKDIDLYIADEFCDKYLEEIDKKYGSLQLTRDDSTSRDDTREVFLKREFEDDNTEKEFLEAMRKGQVDKDACRCRIFDTMRDKIENWWD